MRTHLPRLLVLGTLACGPKHPPSKTPPMPPFTADQIQAAMPTGLSLRFVLTAPGSPPRVSLWAVEAQTDTTVTLRYDEPSADPPRSETRTHTWTELAAHADFPPEATTWTEGPVELAGTAYPRARTYVVHRVEDGHPTEEHFTFSLDHPGPPVLTRTLRHGEEQVRVTLVERRSPGAD